MITLRDPNGENRTLEEGDLLVYEARIGTVYFRTADSTPLCNAKGHDKALFTNPPQNWQDLERVAELVRYLTGRMPILIRIASNGMEANVEEVRRSSRKLTELMLAGYNFVWQL